MKDYVEEAAKAIGLKIAPEHLPGVVLNMERIAALAALVNEFPLDEAEEPMPVYTP